MRLQLDSNIYIRPLRLNDRKSFISMKLKEADSKEVYRGVGLTVRKYLEWHFDTNMDVTRGMYYKDKLFGLIGISDDNTVSFLTTDLPFSKKLLVKHFIAVLHDEMKLRDTVNVHAYVDSEYVQAEEWIKRFGFKFEESIEGVSGDFNLLTYCRQIDANREGVDNV